MSRIAEGAYGDTPLQYPRSPGFKEPTTSRDAANAVSGDAAILREKVFKAIAAAGSQGLTADEAAEAVDRRIWSVRPRLSELRAASRIAPTGLRRANESGRKAIAWKAT